MSRRIQTAGFSYFRTGSHNGSASAAHMRGMTSNMGECTNLAIPNARPSIILSALCRCLYRVRRAAGPSSTLAAVTSSRCCEEGRIGFLKSGETPRRLSVGLIFGHAIPMPHRSGTTVLIAMLSCASKVCERWLKPITTQTGRKN